MAAGPAVLIAPIVYHPANVFARTEFFKLLVSFLMVFFTVPQKGVRNEQRVCTMGQGSLIPAERQL